MRVKIPQLIITFSSTPEAIRMEKYCLENGLPGRMIPVPTQISAGCGLAWKTDPGEKERFMEKLSEAGMGWEKMQVIDI